MSFNNDESPRGDLRRYLEQASGQLRERARTAQSEGQAGLEKLNQIRILEELIREQLPHENTRTPARKAR